MLRSLALGVALVAASAPLYGQGRAEAPSPGTAAEMKSRTAQVSKEFVGVPEMAEGAGQETASQSATGDAARVKENPVSPPSSGAFEIVPPAKFVMKKDEADNDDEEEKADTSFRWRPAIEQSLLFLAVQHGYAMTQPKTRRDLKGEFFHDYVNSVKSLHGWGDGGRFFTNYIAHPMEGSLTGFIQVQNDPKGMRQQFGRLPAYWRSRMKALAWSAAWSTQFEIGPVSQASIGNVGLHGKQTYIDLVITPTVGTGLLVAEDAIDRYVIRRIESGTGNFYVRIGSRMLLNPTRSVANLLRFKKPWQRDR